jgi:pyridoxine/pyridoxamine 5'-phosphate oxidase
LVFSKACVVIQVIKDRTVLTDKEAELQAQAGDKGLDKPTHWGGRVLFSTASQFFLAKECLKSRSIFEYIV